MIGIGVGATAVRAVAVQGDTVRWAMEAECAPDDDLAPAIIELLGRAPISRWPKPAVNVAVGASRSQTKRLVGLPPVTEPTALAQLVREGASRFFLKNGVPLVTSSVRLVEPGAAWAAALEAPVVRALERACETAKVTLRAVVPAAVILGAAIEPLAAGDEIVWRDGDVDLRLAFEAGRLVSARRVMGGTEGALDPGALSAVTPLAALGADAWRFADAYGAVLLSPREPLALRPGHDALQTTRGPRWRRTLAECVCIVSVTAAVLAPGLAATRASRAAAARLAALGAQRAEAVTTARDLGRVSAALTQIADFERTRTSATLLLRTLATALPTGSALVTLRVDSTGGTLVALAPRAGAVVNVLDHTPGITGPEIIGPVTREAVESGELERVTVRFRLDAIESPKERQTRDNVQRGSSTSRTTDRARTKRTGQ